jgi:tryptophanyl-tRNA synthetase
MSVSSNRIVSGMRPTGPLHLGHHFGVLVNWVELQERHECFYFVADWHAMTTEFAEPKRIKGFVPRLVVDWIAAGLDPERSVIFQQSQVKAHAELNLLLSMLTPLGWLERNPTYKDVREQLAAKDVNTFGFLGYPVLQAADILLYKPYAVPVGQDQLPHLELTREIARRFNFFHGELFPEPQALLTAESKLPGLDGRKMSKSYGNAIALTDSMDEIRPKVMTMLTDKARLRKKDPGDPEVCNLFPYHKLMTALGDQEKIRSGCADASWGCVDCKKLLLESLERFLGPVHARQAELTRRPDAVWDILKAGNARAVEESEKTLHAVREALNFNF